MKRTLLAIALLLAGCVAPAAQIEPESVDVQADLAGVAAKLSVDLDLSYIHEVVDVETRHGLVNVDLYVPEGEGPFPTIFVASPYSNANSPLNQPSGGKRGDENWVSLALYEWIKKEMVPRGYAFAQADVLGTRNSGGCQGIMNEAERQSTADAIDAVAAMPWSDGKVGMIGKSYLGMSQIGAAVEAPEHLVTIVPISPPTHDYAYHYYNGVPYAGNHLTNVLYTGTFSLPPPDGDLATYGPRYVERVPCAPESIAAGFYTMGDYAPRWQERDYRPLLANMDPELSVFFIAGHQDWNVKPDHPIAVFNDIPGPKLGLFGQWGHDYPNINNVDEERWGEREEWYLMVHRWFDHWLKGIDTGLLQEMAACPVQTQDYGGEWRCADAFPSREATLLTLYPQADGTLGEAAGSGGVQLPDAEAGLLADAGGQPQEATFTLTVAERMRVYGAPLVRTAVSTTSAWNGHVHAALGVGDDEVTWGFQSLRHRDGLEAGKQVVPGETYEVAFEMYPIDLVLEPGDELVLTLRGANSLQKASVLMLPNPQPGLLTFTLGEATSIELPTATLEGVFLPPTEEQVPEAYVQED